MEFRKGFVFVRAGLAALTGTLFLTTGVFAYWTVTGTSVNVLTSAAYRADIEEEYEIPPHVSPGTAVDKTVNVVNNGNVDMLVRVKVEKKFGTKQADGSLQEELELNPELIEIAYNQNYWKYQDGYWYYTEILKAGKRTREPLFESYRVSVKADEPYKGKDAEIIVTMESVQAEGDGVSLWGIKKEDLGISYRSDTADTVTGVVYAGEEKGFQFSSPDTDLFSNFKNLLPGCARTQKIRIENTSSEKAELFLQATAADQGKMSEAEKELVMKMLSEYVEITVEQKGQLLYQGAVGGKMDVTLGTLEAGETQELIVKLTADPRMEHEMQLLCGKVQWNFLAKGDDAPTVSGTVPKTADQTPLKGLLVLLTISAAWLILFWYNKGALVCKKKQEEE